MELKMTVNYRSGEGKVGGYNLADAHVAADGKSVYLALGLQTRNLCICDNDHDAQAVAYLWNLRATAIRKAANQPTRTPTATEIVEPGQS